jgi:hypothetical protein
MKRELGDVANPIRREVFEALRASNDIFALPVFPYTTIHHFCQKEFMKFLR